VYHAEFGFAGRRHCVECPFPVEVKRFRLHTAYDTGVTGKA